VISAIGPSQKAPPQILVDAARALCDALPRAGVRRLIVIGGAGSLEVAPGTQLVDTPEFPAGWKAVALAHRDALAIYRGSDLDWTYVSPAALIQPGARLGRYRTGGDQLLVDPQGVSAISIPDFALAVADELERHAHPRRRVTFAY
jgi:putative NADH-flavin reductase